MLITIFLFLSYLIFSFLIRSFFKDTLSRVVILVFVSYWHINMLGAKMSNDILDEVNDSTIFVLWLAVIMFVIGFASLQIPRLLYISKNYNYLETKINKLLDNKKLLVLLSVFAIYMVWCYQRFYTQIEMSGIVGNLRSAYYSSDIDIYGPRFALIKTFLLSPGEFVLSALLCYCLLRKRGIICLILLIGLFCYHSLAGGRFGYVLMIIDIIIVYVLFSLKRNNLTIKIKYVFYSLILVFSLFLVLTVVTSMRKGVFEGFKMKTIVVANEETSHEIRTYNFGPIIAFDKAIDNNSFINKIGGYTYGGLSLGPLIYLYRNVSVNIFRMNDFEQPYERVARVQQDTQIKIGPSQYWNALYTWNISFFADFGFFGIFFFNFIIGVWLRSIIRLFYRCPTISSFLLICIVFRIVVWSVFNSSFNSLMLWVLIGALYYFHFQEKRLLILSKIHVKNATNSDL